MIHKMKKVSIVAPRNIMFQVLESVHKAGVLHVTTPSKNIEEIPYVDRLTLPVQEREKLNELENLIGRIDRASSLIKSFLPQEEIIPPRQIKRDMEIVKARTEEITNKIEKLNDERRQIEEEIALYARYEKILGILSPLMGLISESPFKAYTGITLYRKEISFDLLEEAISRITEGRYEILKRDVDEELTTCIIIYPPSRDGDIKKFLMEENISELRVPADLAHMPLSRALNVISKKRRQLPDMLKKKDEEIRRFITRNYSRLQAYRKILKDKLDQIILSSELYGTRSTFYLCGWIPEENVKRFQKDLQKRFQGLVHIVISSPSPLEIDKVPVLLKNPPLIRPFEVLTRFISLPKYGSFDPTPLLAVFFPVLFGLILGDVGYGLILLVIAIWITRRGRGKRIVQDVSYILTISSIMSIIFGILFGEFFGDIGHMSGLTPYIDRKETLIPFLIFSIVIGAAHISLGLIIGTVVAFKRHEISTGVARILKLCFIIALSGATTALAGFLPAKFFYHFVIAGLVIVFILLFFEGWMAPFDTLKLTVNILSYARIMGFGAASVFLASIANQMARLPENIITGIIIGIFFHMINLVVGVYAPAIQTLRLHYVEFFDKFFYPDGIEYKPFGKA